MKKLLILFLVFVLFSCNSDKKSSEIASYTPSNSVNKSSSTETKIPGDFVKKDSIIYGLILIVDLKGKGKYGKPAKAKVIKIGHEGVTMKAMEMVEFNPKPPLKHVRVCPGDIWIEKENELFRTREEAMAYLKEKKLYDPGV